MSARFYRALGATPDERIITLVCLILCAALPILFAGASGVLS